MQAISANSLLVSCHPIELHSGRNQISFSCRGRNVLFGAKIQLTSQPGSSGREASMVTGSGGWRRVGAARDAVSSEETLASQVEEPSLDSPPPPPPSIALHVSLLKQAAHTRKVPSKDVFSALLALEKAKGGSMAHLLPALGGAASPGNTWMLVFTADAKQLRAASKGGEGGGSYFPITAVQRFDATAMEIENGVYMGPLGYLILKGPMGWTGRRLSFLFDMLTLKLGGLGPFKFNIGKKADEGRTPGVGKDGSKDPFFTWFYVDEEIAAARGRGGGSAFWVRCDRVDA